MQNRAVAAGVMAVAVMALVCSASLVSAQFPDSDSEDLDLALPAFPLPPKRDRDLLHMPATVSLGEVSDFEADDTPRFRAVAADEDAGDSEDGEISDDEEAEQVEAEADAEFEAEQHDSESESEGESQTETQTQAEAETTEEVLSEEMEDEDAASAARFAAAGFNPAQMRFASAMSRRYDSNLLPSGPLPVQPTHPNYDIARLPVSAVGDALFTPIHNSQRQFPGASSSASLAGGVNNYAWPTHQRYPNYAYGNANWGAQVNTQFYPKPAPAPVPAATPAAQPAAEAEKPAAEELSSADSAAEEGSFVELGEQQHQSLEQYQRVTAAAGVVYPYAPHLAPRNTPSRNPRMDLAQSEYQTYSRANWPSSVAPPPAYYLPPDVVAI